MSATILPKSRKYSAAREMYESAWRAYRMSLRLQETMQCPLFGHDHEMVYEELLYRVQHPSAEIFQAIWTLEMQSMLAVAKIHKRRSTFEAMLSLAQILSGISKLPDVADVPNEIRGHLKALSLYIRENCARSAFFGSEASPDEIASEGENARDQSNDIRSESAQNRCEGYRRDPLPDAVCINSQCRSF